MFEALNDLRDVHAGDEAGWTLITLCSSWCQNARLLIDGSRKKVTH